MQVVSKEPYVGLRPYTVGDQDRFFGRARESRDVSARWLSSRLLVLYGPSGVGKTSLVQAGVISRFDPEAADVLPVGRVSHGAAFAPADLLKCNPYEVALLSSWFPDEPPAQLVEVSLAQRLAQRQVRTDRYGDPLPLLAAIDQFEEFFQDVPHWQRYQNEFIDQLAKAVAEVSHLQLLISLREEFLAKLIPYEARLAGHSRTRFRIMPLTRDAALEAVTGPLVGRGRSFAPGVADRLVENLRTTELISRVGKPTMVTVESIDPVQLQVVCTALWQALPPDVTTITEEYLQQHGDVDQTVAEFCTQMVAEVAGEHQISERALYEWLAYTFITEHGSRGVIYEGMIETGGMPNAVSRALEDRGILRTRQRFGARWYELQHERLIEPIRQAVRPQFDRTVSETRPADFLRAAEAALVNGELELAEKYAKDSLRLCGTRDLRTRAEIESLLGRIAVQRERPGEAEGYYRQAAEHFDTLRESAAVARLLAEIGELLLMRGCYSDALEALQAAVVRLPGEPSIQGALARTLWSSGDQRGAAALSHAISAAAPDAADALVRQLRAELSDPVAALEDMDTLQSLRPDIGQRPDIRAGRALALARLGRITDAVTEADAAVAKAPGSGPVLLRAAAALRAAGEPERADELLRRAGDARNPTLRPGQLAELRRLLVQAA